MERQRYTSGKKVSDLAALKAEEIAGMDRSELAEVVSRLSSAANKRVKRLEQSGFKATADRETGGRRFSTRGKDKDALIMEYQRVRDFMSKKSTTVSGAKKRRDAIIAAMGEHGIELLEEDFNDVDTLVRKYKELHPEHSGRGWDSKVYDAAQKVVATRTPYETMLDMVDRMEKLIRGAYEEQERKRASGYFRYKGKRAGK